MVQWQSRFRNHQEVRRLLPITDLRFYVSDWCATYPRGLKANAEKLVDTFDIGIVSETNGEYSHSA